jgi:acyl carrier protein
MLHRNEIIAAIGEVIRSELDRGDVVQGIGPDTMLFKGGLELDSFAIVELISQLEMKFAFEFQESDFREEHFRNLGSLSDLIGRYVNG